MKTKRKFKPNNKTNPARRIANRNKRKGLQVTYGN
ncbi:hypothetical protein THIAE_05770 [Thiomicrospira aerophila AL3]|uniref:Uncharacterized protein n=1 Tax=Thiomicrospira aerophila AL3 TaxID=717772 RepID=W0DZI3_9GAMM|nr:hypothetical protein THIAE_05770 [Thiomicrospira aerophila AL3]